MNMNRCTRFSAISVNVCSQSLIDFVDSNGDYFDGSKTYKVTLFPNKISAENNRCGRGEAIKK